MTKGQNPQMTRLHNQALILTLIRNKPNSSRADLSRLSRLSKPVVASIVDDLIEAKLVKEGLKAESTVGRRPIMLNISREFYRIIGIDLSRDHITVLVTSLDGELVSAIERPFEIANNCTMDPRQEIMETIARLVIETGLQREQIAGIGIGYPFPLSASRRLIIGEADIAEWRSIPLVQYLEKRFDVPVYVDNDANLAALHEKRFGKARGLTDFLYLFIGTGVGAGLFSGGQLLKGSMGFAGEVGHLSVAPDGELCVCGKRGCLETELSLKRFRTLMDTCANSKEAEEKINHYSRTVGLYIGNFVNIFNPEAVIVGGSIVNEERIPFSQIEQVARSVAHPVLSDSFELLLAEHVPDSVAKGAVVMVQQHVYSRPENHIVSLMTAN